MLPGLLASESSTGVFKYGKHENKYCKQNLQSHQGTGNSKSGSEPLHVVADGQPTTECPLFNIAAS